VIVTITELTVDLPACPSILELFLAGVGEEGVPLNGPTELGLYDLTVAELVALAERP
jgi:hypothetical protein